MDIHFGHERWHQAASFALRYEVFVLEQGIALKDEFDCYDTHDRNYFAVYDQLMIVATARYQADNPTTIHPDRLCVKKAYRNKGLGRFLLAHLEAKAFKEGFRFSSLSAELSAQSFYEKIGYNVSSPHYMEDGILCVKMTKELVESGSTLHSDKKV